MEQILSLLPTEYACQIRNMGCQNLEELRLKAGAPMILMVAGEEKFLWPKASAQTLEDVLHAACRQSIYSYADTIRQGFVTIEHGHRIGICGSGVLQNGKIINLHAPSSILLRIAHAVYGCASEILPHVHASTLIIGPPGSGKTTLLRDLLRQISDNRKQRIGLIDERGELAACRDGTPQLDVGLRTDVLVSLPKPDAVLMLLRTMGPSWIAMDEITAPSDIAALETASFCGVHLLATAHACDIQDLHRRPLYRRMMRAGIFQAVITIHADHSCTAEEVSI